jgi:hypothetical protein
MKNQKRSQHGRKVSVKVSLSPLIPQEQLVDSVQKDPAVQQDIKAHLTRALIKGQGGLAGEPE